MTQRSPFVALVAIVLVTCTACHTTKEQSTQALPTLSNPNASTEARALYAKLQQVRAKGLTLAGQMWSPWGPDEVELVHQVSGKYPALRGHDLIIDRNNPRELALLINWYHQGGIPTLMWHWGAPSKGEGYEQSKMHIEVDKCFEEGTPEYRAFWNDLRRTADWLSILCEAKVPVLWRPMHEFDGKWFWYGQGGGENFVKIWTTMYDYFTHERHLDNLVWVLCHSHQVDPSYIPPCQYFDLVGADTYANPVPASLYRQMQELHGQETMIPLHECGTLPEPDSCLRDNTPWLWFMLWHTSHAEHHSPDDLRRIYNHERVVTLDELPLLGE